MSNIPLKQPAIGSMRLAMPFCQAGLAGYSDRAMRLVARRRGCSYAVTEALLDIIMLAGGHGLKRSIDICGEDHPVAGQIIGSEPGQMAAAGRILATAGYDVIDLNFACPVKKIASKSRGGHMLADVQRGAAILRAVRDAVPAEIPLTVSLRRGFDDSNQSAERFYEIVEAAWESGCAAIRVHGRTVQQKYIGRAHWPFLRDLKSRYPDRTILGSGDVFTAQDAVRMLSETGVDIVWIARGAIGNPWIFRDAARLLADPNAKLEPPTIAEQRQALLEHFEIAMQIHGESLAGRRMRKIGIKYSRFHPESAQVKGRFIAVHSLRDWSNVLKTWYHTDGPGVWPDERAADEVNDPGDLNTCTGTDSPLAALT
jgi:nifR3 family TIM-barrel protein